MLREDWTYQRYRFSVGLGLPRRVTKPKADHHERMAAHWVDQAHGLGRPAYHEADAFTPDRWMLAGSKTFGRSICGGEKPYGYFSRALWHYVRLAMREAFLAEWHRALGTTYETAEGGRSRHAILTGLTA